MKNLILMTRYPYAALIIAVMWASTALIGFIRQDTVIEGMLLLLSFATIIVALIGFSPAKR